MRVPLIRQNGEFPNPRIVFFYFVFSPFDLTISLHAIPCSEQFDISVFTILLVTPFEVKGPERVTVQSTNSDIIQTGMLTLSGESAKVCVTHTRGYLKLAGWPNTAWFRRGMPGEKTQANVSSLCTPWVRSVIHYNILYVLWV